MRNAKMTIWVMVMVVIFSISPLSATVLYNITGLGGNNSIAYCVNNHGQIVGTATTASRHQAILFDPTGRGNNVELGSSIAGNRSEAYSINNNGQAVGIVQFKAVLFDTTGNNNNIILGTLGYPDPDNNGWEYGQASAINDNGQIVGQSNFGPYNGATTLFDSTGNGHNKYLGGKSQGDWYAINNSGQVVGGDYTTTPYNHNQAMLYDITGNNNNILLGTFGGTYSEAFGINDSGQIVGRANCAGTGGEGLSHAALFDQSGNGNNIDLDPFGTNSTARSINNNGQIVGTDGSATLFDITGAGNNIHLNDLIDPSLDWKLKVAYCINDNGWIVGYGINPSGSAEAFLLTPVPVCSEQIPGDLNGDCIVDFEDFAIMASHWLQRSSVIIANFNLDTNPNWTTQGQWQFGTPMGMGGLLYGWPDPNAAYTGQNVYGVNLNGDYTVTVGGPYTLTTGPFDCNNYATVELSFARWLNTDTADYVQCKVEASNDGSTWQTVWLNSATEPITDNQWQVVEYDISQIAAGHSHVYVRWSYQILSRAYPYSGWNIDDVKLQGLPN